MTRKHYLTLTIAVPTDGEDTEELAKKALKKHVTLLAYYDAEAPEFWVGVYNLSRSYGGPEEGGWWYDNGTLIKQRCFDSIEAAQVQAEKWRKKYPHTGASGSVLGGEDYTIRTGREELPEFFPQERPHYE